MGASVTYLNGLGELRSGGLEGLRKATQQMVRDHDAQLLVIDGMVTAAAVGASDLDYKNFIAQLQTWVGVVGCTVVILASGPPSGVVGPEQTMVDGIIELSTEHDGMRRVRYLEVTKLRGSGFHEGKHSYVINDGGIAVFPRLRVVSLDESEWGSTESFVSSGIAGLDPVLGGGLVRGSSTLFMGSSGAGKTIAAMQFLAEGAARGESCLWYGLFERPAFLVRKADRLGIYFSEAVANGIIQLEWHSPVDLLLDESAHRMLELAREKKIKRLVVDGFAGFRTMLQSERLSAVFTAITAELTRAGVTMIVTDESRELFIKELEVQTQHVSGLFHNIVFLRQVEVHAELMRLVSVMKTRDSDHDNRLWRFAIDDGGVKLLSPFNPHDRGLMAGGASGEERQQPPRG